jgi:hypothetical protein
MRIRKFLAEPRIELRFDEAYAMRQFFDHVLEIKTSGFGLVSVKISSGKNSRIMFYSAINSSNHIVKVRIKPETKVQVWMFSPRGFRNAELKAPSPEAVVNLGCQITLDQLSSAPSYRVKEKPLESSPETYRIVPKEPIRNSFKANIPSRKILLRTIPITMSLATKPNLVLENSNVAQLITMNRDKLEPHKNVVQILLSRFN